MKGARHLYLLKLQRDEEGHFRIEIREQGRDKPRYFSDMAQLTQYLEHADEENPRHPPLEEIGGDS